MINKRQSEIYKSEKKKKITYKKQMCEKESE